MSKRRNVGICVTVPTLAGICGITLLGAGGGGDVRLIDMPGFVYFFGISVCASRASKCLNAHLGTSRLGGNYTVVIRVSKRRNVGICVTVPTSAGICGIPLLGAGGGGDSVFVGMSMGRILLEIGNQFCFYTVGDQLHSGSCGMNLVDHIAGIVFPCNGTVLGQIYQRNAIILCCRANIGIVLLPGSFIHGIQILRKQRHGKDLRIGISLTHLMQHDAIGLAKGCGRYISSVTVDQPGIVHHTGSHLAAVKIIVIDSQIYENHIGINRRVSGIVFQSIIMEINTSIQISSRNYTAIAGFSAKNLGTSPGIVHQQVHAAAIGKVHPPGVVDTFQKTIAARFGVSSSYVVTRTITTNSTIHF